MGYAIFTARKLLLQSRLNNANYQLMMFTQRQQDLAVQTANAQMLKDLNESMGLMSLYNKQSKLYEDMVSNPDDTKLQAQLKQIEQEIARQTQENKLKAASYNAQMSGIKTVENQIELEKQKLQTILEATSNEMKSVEDAEKKNIEASTPKYGGAGG